MKKNIKGLTKNRLRINFSHERKTHFSAFELFRVSIIFSVLFCSCSKLVSIPEPTNSITLPEVFNSDAGATSAIAGVYTQLINGSNGLGASNDAYSVFSDGLSTVLGGFSSDELLTTVSEPRYPYSINKLTAENTPDILWRTAYTIGIYGANAVLEGIASSASPTLTDGTRKQITGEAKFLRAFSYFYLTNFFGDVPLVLTTDFNKTGKMARTKQADVYQQIIKDLKEAKESLQNDYAVSNGERIRPNKWAAAALLARTYLYINDYSNAIAEATSVINNSALYHLEPDLNNVFSTGSSEAIWQLQQNTSMSLVGNATPEGMLWLPNPLHTGQPSVFLSNQLLNSFEQDDKRKTNWIDSTDYQPVQGGLSQGIYYFPYKYKTGSYNYSVGGTPTEYYMVLRLAEQYLIRAEAEANLSSGDPSTAITDLNVIRNRAGLPDLPGGLSRDQVIAAIAKEWQTEFFCEWGQRWFNLKRTGQAHNVLSVIPVKQPWAGDYQLLYPIPRQEIINNHNLLQNPGY